MVRIASRLAILVLAAIGVLMLIPPGPVSGAETVSIKVGDFYFCDPSFEGGVCETKITQGDTVRWEFTNTGMFDFHTTTECGPDCSGTPTPLWDSGPVGPGPGAPFEFTFTEQGEYFYVCTVHPLDMRGKITVNPAPVGGVAELPDVDAAPVGSPDASSSNGSLIIGIIAVAGLGVAAGGAVWYARRRLIP